MSGIQMKYGAVFNPQKQYDIEKAIKEVKLKEYKEFLGRIMKNVLKLGTAKGIDESYKRAISDVSGAIAIEIAELDKGAE